MQDDDPMRRPRAPRPYVLTPAILYVQRAAVRATQDLLRLGGNNEACVFWYGERRGESSYVRSVRAPMQKSTRGNYHVEPEAMSAMVRDLPDIWRPLAQIHSHPGLNTEHSRYDDALISSRKVVSLVFPLYGRSSAPWPDGVGVHEWQIDYWQMLPPDQTERRLSVVDSDDFEVRDFR
jgi:hypothetical protein